MKMINYGLCFLVLTFTSCKVKVDDLELARVPFTAISPKTNGYYFTREQFGTEHRIHFFCLYRNGSFLYAGTNVGKSTPVSLDSVDKYLLRTHGNFINSFNDWGVFNINGTKLLVNRWRSDESPSRRIRTRLDEGLVLSDSTIQIDIGVTASNKIWNYRPFSPKPDSTNCYIK